VATLLGGAASKLAVVLSAGVSPENAARFATAFSEDALLAIIFAGVASAAAVANVVFGRVAVVVGVGIVAALGVVNVGIAPVVGGPATVELWRYVPSLSPALLWRGESAVVVVVAVVVALVVVAAWRTATAGRLRVILAAVAVFGVVGVVGRVVDDSTDRRRLGLDRHHARSFFARAAAGPAGGADVAVIAPEDDDARRADVVVEKTRPIRHVLLFISESTAAARVTTETMPTVTAMADDHAVVFDDHVAESPISIKALFSLLCGVAPLPDAQLESEVIPRIHCNSLSEQLTAVGFRAGLFHGGYFAFTDKLAFFNERGFDALVDGESLQSPSSSSAPLWKNGWGTDDRAVANEALRVLDERLVAGERSLTVVVPLVPHYEYFLPRGAPQPFGNRDLLSRYKNGLRFADDVFRRLRDGYVERGIADDTLMVFVGDHGEAFDEHPGNRLHGSAVYDENLRTPLILWAPGAFPPGGQRSRRPSTHADVMPTVMGLLGLPTDTPPGLKVIAGQDLLSSSFEPKPTVHFARHPSPRLGVRSAHRLLVVNEDTGLAQLFAREDARQQKPLEGEDDVVAGLWRFGRERLAIQRSVLLDAPTLGPSYMQRAAAAAKRPLETRRVFNMVRPCIPFGGDPTSSTELVIGPLSPPARLVGVGVVDESRRRRDGGLRVRVTTNAADDKAVVVTDTFEDSSAVQTIVPATEVRLQVEPSRGTGCVWLAP
jgi:hypothetical protein